MLAPNGNRPQLVSHVPLTIIDATVSARLGTTRVSGNAQPAVFNRQVAMYLAKHVGGWSTTRIGKFYNGRDHSTVCYALKRIEALREANPDIDELLTNLTDEIRLLPARPPILPNSAAPKIRLCRFANALDESLLDTLVDRIVEKLWARALGFGRNAELSENSNTGTQVSR